MTQKITIQTLMEMKQCREPIVMLTAYDAYTASLLDEAGIDIILVGDSYGTTTLGYENTLPVTMDEMLSITAAVARGTAHALVVADMPFMSYQESPAAARRNAGRFLKEAGAHAVKIENSASIPDIIKAVIDIDIPVMGHIGLTPQSVHRMGGFRMQGKNDAQAKKLVEQALQLEDAGVFALVLEGIPAELAQRITARLKIPTIGIGAGPHCDGQVQVINDILGYGKLKPRHAKQYADQTAAVKKAVKEYANDVRTGGFPTKEQY